MKLLTAARIAAARRPAAGRLGPAGGRVLLAIATIGVLEFLVRIGSHMVVRSIADAGMLAAVVGAAMAAGWRAKCSSGRLRLSWLLFAVAVATWEAGGCVWLYYQVFQDRQAPFPSLADVGYLGFPVLVLAALLVRPSSDLNRPQRARGVLDGLLTVGALFNVAWVTGLSGVDHAMAGGSFAFLVGLAYPVSDLVVLSVAVLMISRTRLRSSPLLLGAALIMFVIADGTFAYVTATSSYTSGDNPLTLGWLLGFVLIGQAALHDRPSSKGQQARVISNLSFFLPYLLAAVGVTVGVWHQVRPKLSDDPTLFVATGLVAIVLARQLILLVENRLLLARVVEQDIELRRQVEILADRARHDSLTGLPNRVMFYEQLSRAFALRNRDERPLAVVMCDLENFKLVNDTLGHAAGDELLVWVAHRLRSACRASDLAARLGGDEFAILIEGDGDPRQLAVRIRSLLKEGTTIAGQHITVMVSIGIAQLQANSCTEAGHLVAQADRAMYEDKRRGKEQPTKTQILLPPTSLSV